MTMTFIASQTLAANTNPVSFLNIPQTFTHLQLRMFHRSTFAATTVPIYVCVNGDTTASHYYAHWIKGSGASASSTGQADNNWRLDSASTGSSATANIFSSHIMDILDYSSSTKNKTSRTLSGYDLNGSGQIALFSGVWPYTNPITQIDIYTDGTSAIGSRFDLYGVIASERTGA